MSSTTVVTNFEPPIQFKLTKNIKQAIQSQGFRKIYLLMMIIVIIAFR